MAALTAFGRVSRLCYPGTTNCATATSGYEGYGYDAASNVTSYRTRANQTFTTAYDFLNRPTAITAPAGTPSVSYTYDNLGRLLTANNGATVTRAWDALGRLTSETGPLGTMAYQYDLAGRRTRQTWPDAFFVTNTWNLYGEMTGVLHGGTTSIVGLTYDDLGRRTAISRSNGVSTTYGYDGASRLTSLSHDVGGTAADVTYAYAYNPAGQIVGKTTSNLAYLYTPTTGSTAYTINGLNQVTAAGGSSLTWSSNGNLTNDATRTFSYDAANRLTGSGTATISYDALGRLDNYVGTSGARYLYDEVEAAGFALSGTTIATRFIRGPGTDEILASYTSTGPVPAQFWLSDERGSLVDTVNGSTGVSTAINTYDEYGNPGSGNVGRFQYTGQLWLPSFGTYHYKARAYVPGLGRFMQADPLGYQAGMNLYAYVGNDPVNFTDPLGLDEVGTVYVRGNVCANSHVDGCVPYTAWLRWQLEGWWATTFRQLFSLGQYDEYGEVNCRLPGNSQAVGDTSAVASVAELGEFGEALSDFGQPLGDVLSDLSRASRFLGPVADISRVADEVLVQKVPPLTSFAGYVGRRAGTTVGAAGGAVAGASVGSAFGGAGAVPGAAAGAIGGGILTDATGASDAWGQRAQREFLERIGCPQGL